MAQMNSGEFPQEPILVEDFYPATLVETTEYQKDYGNGPVDKVAWVFEIQADADALDPDVEPEEEFTGTVQVAAHTSLATGPKSNYAKLNFPAFVGEDFNGDSDSVVGKSCEVYVESYETKGGQHRNVITKLRVNGKKKRRAAAKSEAEDFAEIEI